MTGCLPIPTPWGNYVISALAAAFPCNPVTTCWPFNAPAGHKGRFVGTLAAP
jgi:hypothetical protein